MNTAAQGIPRVILVMGVSGSGKTEVGRRLAGELGMEFLEGDDLHPPENIAKMAAGTPLGDADRGGWLDAIRARIEGVAAAGRGVVVACSALRRVYRERLLGGVEGARIVHLAGGIEVIGRRLAARRGHFMPASLLRSQFEALEEPAAGERAIVVDVRVPVAAVVREVLARLGAAQRGSSQR